tara:strand:+ start:16851 stop:20753 length:3903 start_codon:yes stop_codon:yes gene_type:complete
MSDTSKKLKINKNATIVKSFRLIEFNIYDDEPYDDDDDDDDGSNNKYSNNKNFVIQMFGINEKGETCCLYVNDYMPFFYVKVGKDWTDGDKYGLINKLKDKLPKFYQDAIVSSDYVEHNKLYGFTAGQKERFIKLEFQNIASMNKVKNLWYSYHTGERTRQNIKYKDLEIELYESNIPPLLRYFHINNISPSGWISFKLNKVLKLDYKTTTCNYEYICSLKNIIPDNEKETIVPYKICSFDIEASSSHGDFPLPQKDYKRLAMNLVDSFLKQQSFLDESNTKTLIQKVINTAFKYATYPDIDRVYPKRIISEDQLNKRIEILLNKSLDFAKKANTEEDNSYLLTIDDMFAPITGNDGGGDINNDNTNDGNNEVGYTYKKYEKKTKVKKNATIIDILFDDNYTRDETVNIINEVLTKLFPQLEGDKVTFIGSTFMKYGDKEPYLNHCLVLDTCDKVDNIEIVSVTNEKDLLLQWADLIQKENPDIIIGYNIFGFDYEFMFRRSLEMNCEKEFLLLSRKIGEVCTKPNESSISLENTKIVLASGEYDLRYPKISGRLQIDMYAYFRRDFNLSSYKLDDVAGQFISDDIKQIQFTQHEKFGDVTELYSQNLMGLHVGDFIHIELIGFTSDYFDDGRKFVVKDIIHNKEVIEKEKTKTYNVIIIQGHYDIDQTKSLKWGMSKDDVTPQDIFRLTDGDSKDRAIVAKYCIQDCNLVHHLMNKIDVLTGYVEMSRICSVPISFLVFRGQGIKLTSYVAKKCREKDTLMPDVEKSNDNSGYEGAIVLPPKCSMYMDNPVACVDYSSLYPSSMISQNYSHDSKVWSKEYDLEGNLQKITGEKDKRGRFIYDNLPGFQYIDVEFDTYRYIRKNPTAAAEKVVCGKKICRWAQLPNNQKSIMPSILEELLKARKTTRKMIKTENDPFMQNILDKRQLGYKVTANSLYGQCGSKTSTFFEKDVAASTTATGRTMIIYAKKIIEQIYGNMIYNTINFGKVRTRAEYIYGDTDSVFFTFNLENPDTGEKIKGQDALAITIEIAQDAAQLCSSYLKPPMNLEYEKTLMPFILLSKKRYVGMLYEDDPNKGYMKCMGLSLKRRDSCDYLKDVYGGILNILMEDNDIQKSIDYLNESLTNLIEGNVGMDKLSITKALRGYYKNPKQIGHAVLAERIGKRDPGNKPKAGDRMKFVFVVNDNKKALMGDKIETTDYILQMKLQIDYTHYITNQLMKPLQQLFGLALEQIWKYQNKHSAIKTFKKEMSSLEKDFPDIEIFMKKKEKITSAKIKILLFDDILNKIYNKRNHIQTITSFFK